MVTNSRVLSITQTTMVVNQVQGLARLLGLIESAAGNFICMDKEDNMAIKTKDELIQSLNAVLGDNASDEALALMEDVSDTLDDNAARGAVDWEQKYRENDAAWRARYRDRFMNNADNNAQPDIDPIINPAPVERPTFENLFKEA
nr:MAG TPA: hypothetical protein [Caudoviricetes sp.]